MRIAVLLLPGDEMRQHLLGGLAVADEIVVDEIDHRRMPLLLAHGIELGDDLLRRLQPRLPAVETGNVAELAQVGTPARELQREHQIVLQRDEVVRRDREILQRKPVLGFEADLRGRARDALIEAARSADRWHLPSRRCGDSRCPDTSRARRTPTGRPASRPCRPRARARRYRGSAGAWTCMPLTRMTSAHSSSAAVALRIFSSMKRTGHAFRHVGRDQEQALRRHEGAHPLHQPIGVVEGTERGRVMRKNAQDPASVLDWDRAAHATSHPLGRIVASSAARRKRLLFPGDFPCGPFVPGAGFR